MVPHIFRPILAIGLLFFVSIGQAQTVLLAEDFNDCALPADWSATIEGNQDGVWSIGLPDNANSDGSSIDGSCMLIIDDDATGNNTPGWVIDVTSPAFDGTGFTTINLSLDVHFRNYGENNSFQIQVFDGVVYQTIADYNSSGDETGEQFSEFEILTADLSFFANENMRIRIRFDDGGEWVWWAGVDNLLIWGEGEGDNILLESFNTCTLPDGWISEIITGEEPWKFGLMENDNSSTSSMNGSCFLYFDDDGIGQDAAPSTVRLISPEIDGTLGANMLLNFDLILRTWEDNESLIVGVYDVDNDVFQVINSFQTDIGGPQLNDFIPQTLDLSALRSKRMRLVFQYDDGGTWGWWIGLDNIKLSASGELNELCSKAIPIEIGADTCLQANTELALFDGPQPSCSSDNLGSLWYSFTADQSGWLRFKNNAEFNDVISLFTGDCDSPLLVSCDNRDEHGFRGEEHYFNVTQGESYFLRISGQRGAFGLERGNFCLGLSYVNEPPPPPSNELCEAASLLSIDGECVEGQNFWANRPDPEPSRAVLSRAAVWYQFTPATNAPLDIFVDADFADALTIFNGTCNELGEVVINEFGRQVRLDQPEAGQTYFLQVTGSFATIEGNLCARVQTAVPEVPDNNDCAQAIPLNLGGDCAFAANGGASFDGPAISCDPFLDASIWFSFEAPVSGQVQLLADADFPQALSIYSGICGELEEVYCASNPLLCDGYLSVGSLSPGQTYLIRISSNATNAGLTETGAVCLSIRDGEDAPTGAPLDLSVTYECFGNGSATLDIAATGGDGNYFFSGNTAQDVIEAGELFVVVVTDGRGCERSVSGVAACETTACALSASATVTNDASCFNTPDGAASVAVSGGSGNFSYAWPNGATTATVDNLLPGDYVVTITDEDGCDGAATLVVEGPPAIVIDILNIQNANGGPNGSIDVAVNGGSGALAMRWLVNGVYDPDLDPSAVGIGDYQLEVTDESGCVLTSQIITILDPTDTNNPAVDPFWVRASPNPTKGPIRLDWHLPESGQFSVFDATGRLVLQRQALPSRMTNYSLNLTHLASGLYLLRWEAEGRNWVTRIIKVE